MDEHLDSERHHYLRYNRHGVLRPNWAAWAILLFLCRHVIAYVLIGVAAGRGPRSWLDLHELAWLLDPIYLASDIPALAVLLALAGRVPGAGRAARAVWRHGRWLILLSLGAYPAILVTAGPPILDLGVPAWLALGANLILAAYVLRSRYLGDMFGEFPPPQEDK